MHIASWGEPNGTGILPLQHEGFDQQGWSIPFRAGIHCVKITGREDTEDGIGNWKYEPDSQGDLVGGNVWYADYAKRPNSGWAFAWPAAITAQSKSKNVATPGRGGGQGVRRSSQNSEALPLGAGGTPDKRFKPKQIRIPFLAGKAGKDPAAPPPPPPPPQQGGGRGVLRLGIGAQVVPVSGGFAKFSGVRENFSSGSPKAGATFVGGSP